MKLEWNVIDKVIMEIKEIAAENNAVRITLVDGTFKAGEITADDFEFTGTNATGLAAGTY